MVRVPRKIKKIIKNSISSDILDKSYKTFGIIFNMPNKKIIVYGYKIFQVYFNDDLWFKINNCKL